MNTRTIQLLEWPALQAIIAACISELERIVVDKGSILWIRIRTCEHDSFNVLEDPSLEAMN